MILIIPLIIYFQSNQKIPILKPIVTPKIVAASLFQDGYAVITRSIPVHNDGTFDIDQLDKAEAGSIWFSSTKGVTIESIVAKEISVPDTYKTGYAINLQEILLANVGKTITIELMSSYYNSSVPPKIISGKVIRFAGGTVVFDCKEGREVLNIAQINRIIGTKDLGLKVTSHRKQPDQSVFEISTKGQKDGFIYVLDLEKGLSWSPSYYIDLSDSQKLKLEEKGTIINNIGPLDHLETHLVTGFPEHISNGSIDPIVIPKVGSSDVATDIYEHGYEPGNQFYGSGGGGGFGGGYGGNMYSANQLAPQPMNPSGGSSIQNSDLFIYKQGNVNLKKGERGYFPILQSTLDYKEIYTWIEKDASNPNYGIVTDRSGFTGTGNQNEAQGNNFPVWHDLVFTNFSGQPLVSGVAQIFRNGELQGQGQIKYAPKSAEEVIQIDQAADVIPEYKEEEIGRQKKALGSIETGFFDLVSVKETVRITNQKDESIIMRVSHPFQGTLDENSGGIVEMNNMGLNSINQKGVIHWEFPLKAKESKSIVIIVKLYVNYRG